MSRRTLLGITPAVAAFVLTGCGSDPKPLPPAPPVLDFTAVGGADQNPGISGQAAPMQVQLFQLTGTGAFERADIFALAEHAQATLGDAMLSTETFILAPGETRAITRDLKRDTRFIGVAALFRNVDQAVWRASAPTVPAGPTRLALATRGVTVTLTARPDGKATAP